MGRITVGGLFVMCTVQIACLVPDGGGESELEQSICYSCADDVPTAPACGSTCSTSSVCTTACTASGVETTCGSYGMCKSCSSACSASKPCSLQCRNAGALTTCGGYGVCGVQYTYCAYPKVTRSRVVKNHENWPEDGWEYGYMYFAEAGTQKTGTPRSFLGLAPNVSSFDTNVYASNFQGPYKVSTPESNPAHVVQFEARYVSESPPDTICSTSGCVPENNNWGVVDSCRSYPLAWAEKCVTVYGPATTFPAVTLHVKEHDPSEFGTSTDDEVGKFTVALDACRSQVFSVGNAAGWTAVTTVAGQKYDSDVDDNDTIESVSYQLWCYRCAGANDCHAGVGPVPVPRDASQPVYGATDNSALPGTGQCP